MANGFIFQLHHIWVSWLPTRVFFDELLFFLPFFSFWSFLCRSRYILCTEILRTGNLYLLLEQSHKTLSVSLLLTFKVSCFLWLFRVLARDDPMQITNNAPRDRSATGWGRIFKKVWTYSKRALKLLCKCTLAMRFAIFDNALPSCHHTMDILWTQKNSSFLCYRLEWFFSLYSPSVPSHFIFYSDVLPLMWKKKRRGTWSEIFKSMRMHPGRKLLIIYGSWSLCFLIVCNILSKSPWVLSSGTVSPSSEAFPSLCLVCQLLSSEWQSRLTLCWSSTPTSCQGNRWNERNRNQ